MTGQSGHHSHFKAALKSDARVSVPGTGICGDCLEYPAGYWLTRLADCPGDQVGTCGLKYSMLL